MALPKIKHPTYKVVIPSTQKNITFRPYTVQEEKLLLMAKTSDNPEDIISSIKQVIQNCIFEPIDVEKLATFDLEYLFIKLRSKSVGEVVDLEYTDPESKEVIKFKLNLEDVEVKKNSNHTNKIMLQENIGMVLNYPTLDDVRIIEASEKQEDAVFEVLYSCVQNVFDDDNVYPEFTKEEFNEFIESLPIESMNKIREFFDTMPVVEHTVTLKNKAGDTKNITLRGITSFFT